MIKSDYQIQSFSPFILLSLAALFHFDKASKPSGFDGLLNSYSCTTTTNCSVKNITQFEQNKSIPELHLLLFVLSQLPNS